MKFSAQEEYGLRCLVRLARAGVGASLTIPEISEAEGLSMPYVAKLMRLLRQGGFVTSVRGQAGGYRLARSADQIVVGDLLAALGGRLYEPEFCRHHAGSERSCLNTPDCSIRPVWLTVQLAVDQVLNKMTVSHLLRNEQAVSAWATNMVKLGEIRTQPPGLPLGASAER